MTRISLPNGEFQGKYRDRTGIIADYAFAVSDLPTHQGTFSRAGREFLTIA
jgi:hypothetical protein